MGVEIGLVAFWLRFKMFLEGLVLNRNLKAVEMQ